MVDISQKEIKAKNPGSILLSGLYYMYDFTYLN